LAQHVKKVFLVHGEPSQTEALRGAIENRFNLAVTIPSRGQTFELN